MFCHGIHVYSSCCIKYPDRARSNPSRSWYLIDTLTETPLELRSKPIHDVLQLSQNPGRDTLHPSRDHAIEKLLAQSTWTHEPQNQSLEVREQLERIDQVLIMALGVQVQHSGSQPLRVRRFAPNRSKLCATPWFIPCLVPYNHLVEFRKTEVGPWLNQVVVICKCVHAGRSTLPDRRTVSGWRGRTIVQSSKTGKVRSDTHCTGTIFIFNRLRVRTIGRSIS